MHFDSLQYMFVYTYSVRDRQLTMRQFLNIPLLLTVSLRVASLCKEWNLQEKSVASKNCLFHHTVNVSYLKINVKRFDIISEFQMIKSFCGLNVGAYS